MGNDAIPFYEDGDELTCTVITANVTARTLVKIAGDLAADGTFQITPAGAGDRALGVAMWDAVIGQRVTVHTISGHNIMPITQVGALAANDPVKPAAAGKCTKASAGDNSVGICLTSSADGADAMIALDRFVA